MSITGNAQSSPRTATMRAAVWYEPGDIRLEARDRPQATPGSVVLKVEACAVCGIRHENFSRRETTESLDPGYSGMKSRE